MATALRTKPMDASSSDFLRGDPITGDRYYCKDFAQKEWNHMWTRVWHVAGRESQVPDPGNYVVHNVTLTGTFEGVNFFRTEPHPTDPEKCTFKYWFLAPLVEGMDKIATICGERPMEEAEFEEIPYGSSQQAGFHSRGYSDAILSGQESRVRRFHEVLNDYIEGRR